MSSFPKKDYKTTALAGFWVAGQKIPNDLKDGIVVPRIGHLLKLTEMEAKYELMVGAIEPASAPAPKKPPAAA